jgi:hypothetical protein
LIVEWNASTNMFYLLKNLLLLIMVIFKLKCNNLIFNEIMVLNDSYVCLHAFSLRRESPDLDPGRRTPHFWGGSVTHAIGTPPVTVVPFYRRLAPIVHPHNDTYCDELADPFFTFRIAYQHVNLRKMIFENIAVSHRVIN